MAASAGSLVVSLGLDAAEYTRGLSKAQYQARQFGEAIGAGLRSAATTAAAGLAAITASAVGAAVAIDGLIKAAGDFQDLADMTGASAVDLAGLAVAAATAGVSMDSVASASIKLTKSLTGVDDESKAAGAALAAIGLNVKDFKQLDPVAQYEAVGKALAGFADGAGKTAVAVALWGKAGAEQLKVMKALEDQGGRTNILTAEQIRLADSYADAQAKSRAELTLHAQAIATNFIPALTAVQNAIKDTIGQLLNADKAQRDFALNLVILDWAEKVAVAIGTVVEAVVGLGRTLGAIGGSFQSVFADLQLASKLPVTVGGLVDFARSGGKDLKDALDNRNKVAAEANQRYVDLWNYDGTAATRAIKKAFADQRAVIKNSADPEIQRLLARSNAANTPTAQVKFNGATKAGGGGGGSGDDPTKKVLDNNLKALENAAAEERDILASRNKMLDLYNGQALISTQAYFEGRKVAADAALSSQQSIYDQEIAALQSFMAKAGKATDREAAQGKINDLLAKKAKLSREAGEAALEWTFKEQQAIEALARSMNSVNAEVLELTGNLGAAARIRVNDQFDDLSKRLSANGDSNGLAQVNKLKQLKIAQADFGQQSEDLARITANLSNQEDRISISRQLGADSELSSLIKLRDARGAAVQQMRSIVEAQEAIANASGNPALVQNAERARLELDKLFAAADPLADKFNNIFTESFGNAFADFITGTKTAKEAFQSFASSVIGSLAKMAAESAAKEIFSSFSSGTSSAGTIGSLLSSLFGKAGGGNVAPGSMHRVNENGPELLDVNGKQYLMNGNQNARVTATNKMGGGMVYSPTFVISEPASRRTQEQIALQGGRGVQSALARNS